MKVLLGSGGIRGEEKVALYHSEMAEHFLDIDEVLFIPYAGANHDYYLKRMQEFSQPSGVNLVGIHHQSDPAQAIRDADAIYVGGGNTFLLTRDLHNHDLIRPVRERVEEGIPYMGVSAGSNVAGPTMQTTNDMPIVMPKSFETFGITPFQINPHYISGGTWKKSGDEFHPHHGETRAQRIKEFHEHNPTPVIGLTEGTYLRWNGTTGKLVGGEAFAHKPKIGPLCCQNGSLFDSDLSLIQ